MIQLLKDNFVVAVIVIAVIFYFIVLPYIDKQNKKESQQLRDNFEDIKFPKLDMNQCSRQCCKHTQWPVPFNTTDPNAKPEDFKDYIGSNFSCNNGQVSGGCVCIKKDDYEYLSIHGQNKV